MAWRRPRPASAPIARTQEPWLIACALLTLAPHAQYAPLWLSIVTAIALAWRAAIWWLRRALPPRWLLTALVVGGTLAVFATYRQLFGKDPGVALLIIFLALKLLELRSVRDALAAVFLCYFLLLTHFLNAQEIENAATTVAALLVITAALASLSRAGRGIGGNLRLAALMLAQAVPFMLILFLLFPRVEGPLWGLPIDAYSTENELVIIASVPGVNPEEVEITIEGDTLMIKGEVPAPLGNVNYIMQERGHGRFSRTLTLNVPVQADKAEAEFVNGILTLRVPKAEAVRPRTIKVTSK